MMVQLLEAKGKVPMTNHQRQTRKRDVSLKKNQALTLRKQLLKTEGPTPMTNRRGLKLKRELPLMKRQSRTMVQLPKEEGKVLMTNRY